VQATLCQTWQIDQGGDLGTNAGLMIGSANELGMVDLSPKGDGAGFVRSLDDKTLVIPDRPATGGSTPSTTCWKPGVGLIFFVPGQRETLRVTGQALIVRDQTENLTNVCYLSMVPFASGRGPSPVD
jgi:predicted pyridoxine 5'-phosphate oxidase superfamily flavin-nucleotide-binding protein